MDGENEDLKGQLIRTIYFSGLHSIQMTMKKMIEVRILRVKKNTILCIQLQGRSIFALGITHHHRSLLRHNASLCIKYIILACIPLAALFSNFSSLYVLKDTVLKRSASLQQGTLSLARAFSQYMQKYVSYYELLCKLRWRSPYARYRSPEEEEMYWRQAEIGLKELAHSDARYTKTMNVGRQSGPDNMRNESQILYYTPRLLPQYREKKSRDLEGQEIRIPATTFLKWFRLTFPEKVRHASVYRDPEAKNQSVVHSDCTAGRKANEAAK